MKRCLVSASSSGRGNSTSSCRVSEVDNSAVSSIGSLPQTTVHTSLGRALWKSSRRVHRVVVQALAHDVPNEWVALLGGMRMRETWCLSGFRISTGQHPSFLHESGPYQLMASRRIVPSASSLRPSGQTWSSGRCCPSARGYASKTSLRRVLALRPGQMLYCSSLGLCVTDEEVDVCARV